MQLSCNIFRLYFFSCTNFTVFVFCMLSTYKLKTTPIRERVLQIMKNAKYALTHQEIEEFFEDGVDRVTLYRTLNTFVEKGIVHKILDEKGASVFAICKDACTDHHHIDQHLHFFCSSCHKTYCLHEVKSPTFKLPNGFTVSQVDVKVTGVCQNCENNH